MKYTLAFILFGVTFLSCSDQTDTAADPTVATKLITHKLPALSVTPIPALHLNPKLKCGLVADLNEDNDTVGYHTYINDTLYGPVFSANGMAFNEAKTFESPTDGFYVRGKKEGQFNFYSEGGALKSLAYFEQDDTIWKSLYLYRWKSFPYRYLVTPFKDEVVAELKHPNGEVWYKGEFKNKKPKGEHSIHRKDGTKAAVIDYNDWTLARYNYDEELQYKGIIKHSWTTYIGR